MAISARTCAIAWALCTCVLFSGCNSKPGAPAAEANPAKEAGAKRDEVILSAAEESSAAIETQVAEVREEPDVLRVRGRIVLADDRTYRVGVRTVGLVVAVYAGLGDYVHKGQILARYHADEVRDQRAQYRGALSEMARAQAAQALAVKNRDRMRRLLELKSASVQQVEQAEQELSSAESTLKRAQIEVDRGRDLLEDDLRVPADPAPDSHDETADQVPIFAPESGYVLEKNITPGKTVELSAETFVIGDLSKVWMLASVRQEDLGKLVVGRPVSVSLAGVPDVRFPGKIANLGQELDAATRTMQVRISLENRGQRLRPEMLATAEIPVGGRASVVVVPSDALQEVNGQDVVFVRTGPRHFSVRTVKAGETSQGKTPILDGLRAGETVAVHGSFILKSQLLKSTLESE